MAVPVYVAGQILNASDCNNWFIPTAVAIKPSDTGRASTTALANDPDLVLGLSANSTYEITGNIFYDGGTGVGNEGDIKYAWAVPTSGSFVGSMIHLNVSGNFAGAFQQIDGDANAGSAQTQGIGVIMILTVSGMVTVASTAGNLTFRWAQNTSETTNTHVKANSYLVARRIS